MLSRRDLDKVNTLIVLLGHQESRLRRAIQDLEQKKARMEYVCKECLLKGDEERARMYAFEIAGIMGAIKLVRRIELRVQILRLRLISIKQFIIIWDEMQPTIRKVRENAEDLKKKAPWLKRYVDDLCVEAEEMLRILQPEIDVSDMGVPFVPPESILEEIKAKLEGSLESYLPTPPEPLESQPLNERPTRLKKPQPILVSLESFEEKQKAYMKPDPEELEKELLRYIVRNGNKINLGRCAVELGVSKEEILDALKRLSEKGKIRLGG